MPTREFQLERAPRPNLAQLTAEALAVKELVVEFATPPPPEKLQRMLDGLRQHFPRRAIWYANEGQGRIYARETDPWQVQLMRVFCVGLPGVPLRDLSRSSFGLLSGVVSDKASSGAQ